jgi:hypothetical protein
MIGRTFVDNLDVFFTEYFKITDIKIMCPDSAIAGFVFTLLPAKALLLG